jgi:hypothetical protein
MHLFNQGCYIHPPFRKLRPEVKVSHGTKEKKHGSHIHNN